MEIDLPPSPSTERLEWLRGELGTVLKYLDQLPQERPSSQKAEGSPLYAAGLRDMAEWILEKVEHDIEWQSLRQFLGGYFDLPADSSTLSVRKKRQRSR